MLEERIRKLHAEGRFREAITVALEGYGPELLSFLSVALRSEMDVNDVFGMTCLDLWNGIRGFRFECTFRTWAYLIARHAQVRYSRKEGSRGMQEALSSIPHLSEIEGRVRTATRPYLRSAMKDRVSQLRAQLTPDEQMLLVLRIDRDLPWTDVARIVATGDDAPMSDAELTQCAAMCRKKFERITAKLRRFAEEQGLFTEA